MAPTKVMTKRTSDDGGEDRVPSPAIDTMATASMPALAQVGLPPAMPVGAGAARPMGGLIDDPARLVEPDQIPGGEPEDPAASPGRVPAGEVDASSLRRGGEFALVYRRGTVVIGRFGVVGTRGTWRKVEYPTVAAASNAYANETAQLIADGWRALG
jgi:hypothetical protein